MYVTDANNEMFIFNGGGAAVVLNVQLNGFSRVAIFSLDKLNHTHSRNHTMMSLRVRALVQSTHSFFTRTIVRLRIKSRLDGGVHSIIVNILIEITSHISIPS